MILQGTTTLFGLELQMAYDAQAVAEFLAHADFASSRTHYDIVAIAEGLQEAAPSAAELFKDQMVVAVNGGEPEKIRSARTRLCEIIGNVPGRHWVPAVRFAVKENAPEKIGEMYLADMERLALKVLDAVYNLPKEDDAGLERINRNFHKTMIGMNPFKNAVMAQASEKDWLNALFSSGTQFGQALSSVISMELDQFRRKKKNWDDVLRRILKFHTNVVKMVLGKQGYRIPHVKREIGDKLMSWLQNNFPVRRWENDRLVMVNVSGPVYEGSAHLRPKKWPPNGDPAFEKYLRLLGWTIEFHRDGDRTVATLDFGEQRLAAPPENGPPKNPKGEWELSSLTPAEVATLTPVEHVALAKQLMQAVHNACSTVQIFVGQLNEGDVEGLKKLEKYLRNEMSRLIALFPQPEDQRLLYLFYDLISSAKQMFVLVGTLALSQGSWQEILGFIAKNLKNREIKLFEDKTITTSGTKRELANNLWYWLLQRNPQLTLDSEMVILTYPNDVAIQPTEGALQQYSPWPPDPKNDIVLKTYLEVLGWKMWVNVNKVYLIPNEHFDPASLPLRQKLQLAWARHKNPPVSEVYTMIRRKYNAEWIQKNMPRLCAVLDTLIAEKIKEGKKREDLVVCVAAHGSVDFFAIIWLLHRGVTVVSREKAIYHNSMFLDSEEMRSANREGRLILSDYTKPHPAKPYDIAIWSHPASRDLPVVLGSYSDDGRLTVSSNPIPEMVIENLNPDGWFLMQTDSPDQFIDPFYGDTGRFEALWQENSLSDTNYLMPSSHFDTGDQPTLALFRRTPA